MNKDSFSFVIYMIHACADAWKKMPNYDVLHIQGTKYIIEDIQEYLRVRGTVV